MMVFRRAMTLNVSMQTRIHQIIARMLLYFGRLVAFASPSAMHPFNWMLHSKTWNGTC
jgi:hypothetical protein